MRARDLHHLLERADADRGKQCTLECESAGKSGPRIAATAQELSGNAEELNRLVAQFKVAELPRDAELLERARRHAQRVVDEDPSFVSPEHALLADALVATYGAEARAPIRA